MLGRSWPQERPIFRWIRAYLYTPAQVGQLMAAARKLRERYLADATYVLIGLLYVTAFEVARRSVSTSRISTVRGSSSAFGESSTASVWCPST